MICRAGCPKTTSLDSVRSSLAARSRASSWSSSAVADEYCDNQSDDKQDCDHNQLSSDILIVSKTDFALNTQYLTTYLAIDARRSSYPPSHQP